MVERKAIALNRPAHDRQEIDQIFAAIGDWPRVSMLGNSALPPSERRLHDPFVDRVMVASADRQSEPPRVCRRPFGLSYAAMAGASSMA